MGVVINMYEVFAVPRSNLWTSEDGGLDFDLHGGVVHVYPREIRDWVKAGRWYRVTLTRPAYLRLSANTQYDLSQSQSPAS